jgi:hypothetical protein
MRHTRECHHHDARPSMSWPFGDEAHFDLACSHCPHAYKNVPSRKELGSIWIKMCELLCWWIVETNPFVGAISQWYLQSPWLPTLFHILGQSVSSCTWRFLIERNWSMLAVRARLMPMIFRSRLTLPWTARNASMLFWPGPVAWDCIKLVQIIPRPHK